MTGLLVELRRGPGIFVAPMLVAAGLFYSAGNIDTLTLWSVTTAVVANAVFLIGPMAAGVAAWAGGRARRRVAWYGPRMSVQGPAAAATVEVGALLVWTLGAYAIFAAILFGITALQATWGAPTLLWVAAAVCGLSLQVIVGWAVGRLIPFRLTPPAVAVGLFLTAMWVDVSVREMWWSRLFPFKVWLLRPFDEVRIAPMLAQLAWYAGIGLVVFAGLCLLTRARWRTIAVSTVVAAAALTYGFTRLANDAKFANDGRYVLFTCAGDRPEVCVHPAYVDSLPELRRRAEGVAGKLAGTPYAITRVEHRPRGGRNSLPSAGALGFGFDAPVQRHFDQAAVEMATGALGVGEACFGDDSRDPPGGLIAMAMVVDWAAGIGKERQLGGSLAKARDWINGQSDENVRQWLITHQEQIAACQLSLTDFR